jgi:hypothetical protein
MKYISLDIATISTGVTLWEDDKIIKNSLILCDDNDENVRFINMCVKIRDVYLRFNPDIIIYEDIGFNGVHSSYTTTILLSKLHGLMQYFLNYDKFPHIYAPISKWRSYLGIKGKKRLDIKNNGINYVNNNYNYNFKPYIENPIKGYENDDDLAESILIGEWFWKNKNRFTGIE